MSQAKIWLLAGFMVMFFLALQWKGDQAITFIAHAAQDTIPADTATPRKARYIDGIEQELTLIYYRCKPDTATYKAYDWRIEGEHVVYLTYPEKRILKLEKNCVIFRPVKLKPK